MGLNAIDLQLAILEMKFSMKFWELKKKLKEATPYLPGQKILQLNSLETVDSEEPVFLTRFGIEAKGPVKSLINKFGGAVYLRAALEAVGADLRRSSIFGWSWPTKQNTKRDVYHHISPLAWPYIIQAADRFGIKLGVEDGYRPHMRLFQGKLGPRNGPRRGGKRHPNAGRKKKVTSE